jgi:hypothetical protein
MKGSKIIKNQMDSNDKKHLNYVLLVQNFEKTKNIFGKFDCIYINQHHSLDKLFYRIIHLSIDRWKLETR